eukprot:gene715-764_t
MASEPSVVWTETSEKLLTYLYHLNLVPAKGISLITWQTIALEINEKCNLNVTANDCRVKILSMIEKVNEERNIDGIEVVMREVGKRGPALIVTVTEVMDDFSDGESEEKRIHEKNETSSSHFEDTQILSQRFSKDISRTLDVSESMNDSFVNEEELIGDEKMEVETGFDSLIKSNTDWTEELDSYLIYLRDSLQTLPSGRLPNGSWDKVLTEMKKTFPDCSWFTIERCRNRFRQIQKENQSIYKEVSLFVNEEEESANASVGKSEITASEDNNSEKLLTENEKSDEGAPYSSDQDDEEENFDDEADDGAAADDDNVDEASFTPVKQRPKSPSRSAVDSSTRKYMKWTVDLDYQLLKFRQKFSGALPKIYKAMVRQFPSDAQVLTPDRCRRRLGWLKSSYGEDFTGNDIYCSSSDKKKEWNTELDKKLLAKYKKLAKK